MIRLKKKLKILPTVLLIAGSCVLSTPTYAEEPKSFRDVMIYMGEHYTKVTQGILKQDYQQLANAANVIAFHPEPPLAQRMKIIAKLGGDFLDFKSWDDKVHLSATALAQAAKDEDINAVLEHNAAMLKNCTACHIKYRALIKSLRTD